LIRGDGAGFTTYDAFRQDARGVPEHLLDIFDTIISPHDVANLQFTSGSTGRPKAAMLTHQYVYLPFPPFPTLPFPTDLASDPLPDANSNYGILTTHLSNLVNNSTFISARLRLTPTSTLCCPPPLFHCFGLTLGLLACLTSASTIVFPSEAFDPRATVDAIHAERCTALHGVPAMIEAILNIPKPAGWKSELTTGIVAGSPVPKWLMQRMVKELGMRDFTSSYGLTEASPTVFNAHVTDSMDARLETVGTVMPHARVKIVDARDVIVPIGVRGELCVAGYQVCRGYWQNEEKTREVMVRDEQGEVWLHTGDEAMVDVDGYCTITGRFKDIIIRGTSRFSSSTSSGSRSRFGVKAFACGN
jgi:acyl-CoA synthetase (AMP-forming)/AMP-acid ligase II